jgi:hypothetical protein
MRLRSLLRRRPLRDVGISFLPGLLLCPALLVHTPASAAEDTAAESLPEAGVVAPPEAGLEPTSEELITYELAMARLEVESGPYNPLLAEIMISAAGILTELGRYDDALLLLRRALQIRRVHIGLYDLSHVQILERVIENDFALGDAGALDRDYQHMYWIYRRNFGENDPRLVPLLEHIADQRVRAYHAAGRGNGTLHHAIVADQMNDRARHMLEPIAAEQRERYLAALYRTAVINYLIARDARDPFVSIHEIRAAMLEAERPMFDNDDPEVREEIEETAFFKGALALKAARKLTAEREREAPGKHAAALAFEGDWYWVFRRKWDASRRYREAWDVLVRNAAPESEFTRIFGQPRRLKPFTMPEETETPRGRRGWVEALIEVSDAGWPDNIRVTASFPPYDTELRDRGALGIAAIMYRPRMEEGKPVASSDVPIRYYLER